MKKEVTTINKYIVPLVNTDNSPTLQVVHQSDVFGNRVSVGMYDNQDSVARGGMTDQDFCALVDSLVQIRDELFPRKSNEGVIEEASARAIYQTLRNAAIVKSPVADTAAQLTVYPDGQGSFNCATSLAQFGGFDWFYKHLLSIQQETAEALARKEENVQSISDAGNH